MMCFLPPTYTLEIPFLIVREQDLSYYPISKDDQGEDAEELGYWPPECFAHSSPKGPSIVRCSRLSKIWQTDLPFKRLQELS
jgi:hypothetical protein